MHYHMKLSKNGEKSVDKNVKALNCTAAWLLSQKGKRENKHVNYKSITDILVRAKLCYSAREEIISYNWLRANLIDCSFVHTILIHNH